MFHLRQGDRGRGRAPRPSEYITKPLRTLPPPSLPLAVLLAALLPPPLRSPPSPPFTFPRHPLKTHLVFALSVLSLPFCAASQKGGAWRCGAKRGGRGGEEGRGGEGRGGAGWSEVSRALISLLAVKGREGNFGQTRSQCSSGEVRR